MNEPVPGHLAANVVGFSRSLRRAGIPVGTAAVLNGLRAVACVGLERREDVSAALRCTLLSDHSQQPIFDALFRSCFDGEPELHKFAETSVETAAAAKPDGTLPRFAAAVIPEHAELSAEQADSPGYSGLERLRDRDFASMSAAERAAAQRLLAMEMVTVQRAVSRRFRPRGPASLVDLRQSLRLMTRSAGEPLRWARKARCERPPTFVLLGDVSASMRAYSRLFLAFAHAMTAQYPAVHSFVFATRLSNVSRQLRQRNVDTALAGIAAKVRDWEGGTRIGAALRHFNLDWRSRVLSGDAIVVLLTDGLERDAETRLGDEMQRLALSCRQLIWLNPLLRFDGFEPRASGIRTMLPFVERMLPAHNVSSLIDLGKLLQTSEAEQPMARRGYLRA